jgi:hypothetical protein
VESVMLDNFLRGLHNEGLIELNLFQIQSMYPYRKSWQTKASVDSGLYSGFTYKVKKFKGIMALKINGIVIPEDVKQYYSIHYNTSLYRGPADISVGRGYHIVTEFNKI